MDCSNVSSLDYKNILISLKKSKEMFINVWKELNVKCNTDIPIEEAIDELRNLVIYDILDGNRSTKSSSDTIDSRLETGLYAISLINILKNLGARSCIILIHTDYNRQRGYLEFRKILDNIKNTAPLINQYFVENDISCHCLFLDDDYECSSILHKISESTKKGSFNAFFLFDYNERWISSEKGKSLIESLPEIDVHIRHTKLQMSGGWIPDKMARSCYVYSQNGTIYSNWNHQELLTLISCCLLQKLTMRGELLSKIYRDEKEISLRYTLREEELFNKIVWLNENPSKLALMSAPYGIYQLYF
jgi:hypothetical protein